MENAKKLWLAVKEKLKAICDDNTFQTTFLKIDDVYKVNNGYIYLTVDTVLEEYRITKFYLSKMNDFLSELTTEKMNFKIITTADAKKETEAKEINKFTQPDSNSLFKSRSLRPEYTFDNFVTGEANREAFTFSLKVANAPHVTVNPLYIFGDVGLGKTHLMTAIGHFILDNDINANVIFTTAQQYADDYFSATNKSTKNTDAIDAFNSFYRSADLLLVDDIQFLENKKKTQEEFFKLFEYLHENNKQIVITSDRPASELPIMDRLKSRFSWGIPVDIKKPNFNLRKAILKNKLNFLITDANCVPENVLDFIANGFEDNIRELEGALRRFVSYCVAFNIDFTLEAAETSLASIITKVKQDQEEINSAVVEKIKNIIASYYNINVKELSSASRKQDIVYARTIAMYILRTQYNFPLKKIGDCFGGRDHATVAHALDKIEENINIDTMIKQDIDVICSKISK